MDFTKMLAGKKDCACGREHLCPIKGVSIGNGAIADLSEYARDYKNILVVCDQNTLKVGGEKVRNFLVTKFTTCWFTNQRAFWYLMKLPLKKWKTSLRKIQTLLWV